MSSDRFEEIPQLEDLEVEEALSLEASGSKSLPLKRKKPISHVIELESDTDTSGRQQIAKSRKYNKNNKNSEKIELNKITNQLVLIPNAKPPGQSWIWGYFDQYKPVGQYKRIVRCLAQVQRKNGAEQCGHFMGSDNSTGNFIAHLATHQITEESHKRKMNEVQNNGQLSQLRIDEIIRNNPDIKNNRDRKFVGILIKDNRPIINILEDFAGATEYLGGSNYTTISLMYSLLAVISNKMIPDDSNVEVIDLTSPNTAFDDDVGYEDAPEDEITQQPKHRKININTPQNCFELEKRVKAALYQSINHYWEVPQEQRMLAALLDPRFKDLEFASETLRLQTHEQLKDAYKNMKILTNESQEAESRPTSSNSLLARMFKNSHTYVDE
ncbi:9951_t:CDS:2, partial [Rhizophagus irregularis]